MASTTLTEREERIKGAAPEPARQPGRLPLPRQPQAGHLRRQGEVDQEARRRPLQQGVELAQRHGRVDREHRVRRHPDRGRGAARRAELHQAVPADLQRPPARRQVVPLHRGLARREVPARLLHAREAPARPRSTSARTRTRRRCARRSTCSARCSSTAAATAPSPGARPAARASTTTSSAAARPASATCREEEYREGIDKVVDFLSGRYRADRARPRGRDEAGVRRAGVRDGGRAFATG